MPETTSDDLFFITDWMIRPDAHYVMLVNTVEELNSGLASLGSFTNSDGFVTLRFAARVPSTIILDELISRTFSHMGFARKEWHEVPAMAFGQGIDFCASLRSLSHDGLKLWMDGMRAYGWHNTQLLSQNDYTNNR